MNHLYSILLMLPFIGLVGLVLVKQWIHEPQFRDVICLLVVACVIGIPFVFGLFSLISH